MAMTALARAATETRGQLAFLDAVDAEMARVVGEAAALQLVAVPDVAWRGGKRVRPRLVYETSLGLGLPPADAVPLRR